MSSTISAYLGHITGIEVESDLGGRFWFTFDATGPRGAEMAAQVEAFIAEAAADGELSDIDCTGNCPCTLPVAGCPYCDEEWMRACGAHRATYTA